MTEFYEAVVANMARDMDKLALDMILRGHFPSAGWRIGYDWEQDGMILRYTLREIPPA
jgi:hypothetical protein